MALITVRSRSIAAVDFDASHNTLDILFRNGLAYRYWGISTDLFTRLMSAASLGRFFNAWIRGRYTSVRIG